MVDDVSSRGRSPVAGKNGEPEERTTRTDFMLAVLMALAAVGTAWAGFQSTEWSGVQANSYAQASTTRFESNQHSTEAGQDQLIDTVTFGSWLSALDDELLAAPDRDPADAYQPGSDTVTGFVSIRFRDEFKPAMDAWLETDPFENPDAPATPFQMPQYQLAAGAQAQALWQRADDLAAKARLANQRATNYVLNAVIFALVLFFGGVASRAHGARARKLLFWFAIAALAIAVVVLATMPVTI